MKSITAALLRKWPLPKPDGTLGKEDRGQVLVVGGSTEVPGAVMLAAIASLRAGAGKLQIATARTVAAQLAIAVPEARVIGLKQTARGELARGCSAAIAKELERCDALLIGPGMMDAAAAREIVDRAIKSKCGTLVVDAGALNAFRTRRARSKRPMILTPHAGEMASLCGIDRKEVLADPAGVARDVAHRLHAIVALKGAKTFIAAPDGTTYRNTAGNVGLGTSGSGDTLSGVIAGLCARGADPMQAAVWGVFVHARAGEILARKIAPLGYLARDLLAEVPHLLSSM
jgi:ADP-dependent NAD(P)H-hydrate dehydratase